MILQWASRAASVVVGFALVQRIGAQAVLPSASLTVSESRSRTTLQNEAIELDLPLTSPAMPTAHLLPVGIWSSLRECAG